MSETKKPRLCEVLGVEVNELFTCQNGYYDKYWISEDGIAYGKREDRIATYIVGGSDLCWLINHPEKIAHLSPLTEPEFAICRAVGAKWVSMDKGSKPIPTSGVDLWSEKPDEDEGAYNNGGFLAQIVKKLFPSVKPGDCICVEEIAG